ncbi:M23 family metallopeptidase [Paenibacillus ginsengihumi]|uniref:M23 family metallopeptidase n=1 Tax=Paenibacillus ginsengihumi TaxID=431596 RepID=UPI000A03CA47|nr:M23 family metallopeptidase [Paenibacillus ginsengihumi]
MKNLKKKVILTSCVFTMIFSVSASISAAQDSTQNLPSKSIVPYDVPVGYGAMGWDWPTTGETISDGWGWTGSRFHKGIDIAVYKQNVYAAADGEVLGSGVYSDSVQYVTIKHDQNAIEPGNTHNKLVSRYLHLVKGSQKVKKGDRVNQGQTIGTSGNSGASDPGKDNNYHLHFDINNKSAEFPSNNDTIDPMLFYPYNFGSIPNIVLDNM